MNLSRKNSKKKKKPPKVCAVIVAAGSSKRMNGLDKLTAQLAGRSVLEHSIYAFASCAEVGEIVVVTREDLIMFALEAAAHCGNGKVTAVIQGGGCRTESSYLGVMRASRDTDIILIHDGARPLVTEEVIKGAIEAAKEFGAALPALPVKDTLKTAADGFVVSTPDRSRLYAAQTPQAFNAELIKAALTAAVDKKEELSDDCLAVEKLGMSVKITAGSADNIKITTPEDLIIAEALLQSRAR
jgi:2-C-methyl-D-erythritol 4-phosphate cytidylyltransferase